MVKNKVLLITGATKGIGLETARVFGQNGFSVAINGRNEELGKGVLKKLREEGIDCEFLKADVTDEEAVNNMVEKVVERFGALDVLINNAGGLGGRQSFEGMSTEFWDSVVNLNLKSVFFVSRACIPYLKKVDSGSIINVTSIAAYNGGGPGAGVYAISKSGISTFTKALAKELIPFGIRVNAISPGTIDTDFHSETPKDLIEVWKNGIPAKRLGKALEVANATYFLASEQASYIVGEVIQINGGQMML